MTRSAFSLVLLLISFSCAQAQLKPGFDAGEYTGTIQRSLMQVRDNYQGEIPLVTEYKRVYRSPEVGLHNRYELWLNKDKTIVVINLRGTTADLDSWLENFYAAMIPATGTLKISDSNTFHYQFAADPKATVHVGWALGIGSMAPGIMRQVQAYYAQGVKQLIVEGHSQGGALAFLLTSYLHYQVAGGKLPKDMVIKAYCSAAPKPGNLFYAYDFDYIMRGGWAFTVVNAADWVPETPFSVQTLKDFNQVNPFVNAKSGLRKQKLLVRLYTTHIYNKLNRTSRKTQRKYEQFLGRAMYKQVKRYMPGYERPGYAPSGNYMRAGIPIVLQPDAEYRQKYPDNTDNIFRHHLLEPYYYLLKKTYLK